MCKIKWIGKIPDGGPYDLQMSPMGSKQHVQAAAIVFIHSLAECSTYFGPHICHDSKKCLVARSYHQQGVQVTFDGQAMLSLPNDLVLRIGHHLHPVPNAEVMPAEFDVTEDMGWEDKERLRATCKRYRQLFKRTHSSKLLDYGVCDGHALFEADFRRWSTQVVLWSYAGKIVILRGRGGAPAHHMLCEIFGSKYNDNDPMGPSVSPYPELSVTFKPDFNAVEARSEIDKRITKFMQKRMRKQVLVDPRPYFTWRLEYH